MLSLYHEPKPGQEKGELPEKLLELLRRSNKNKNQVNPSSPLKKKTRNAVPSVIVNNFKEQFHTDVDYTMGKYQEIFNNVIKENSGNPAIQEAMEQLQEATSQFLNTQFQKFLADTNMLSQELDKLRFSIGPKLDDSSISQNYALNMVVEWSWVDDRGKFMPYDAQTTIVLETNYQKNPKGTFPLNHGFFADKSYIIDFNQMLQINHTSNNQRTIQRRINWIPYSEHKKKILELQNQIKQLEDKKKK